MPPSSNSLTLPASFRALPAYLGGKRRLAPIVMGLVQEALPRSDRGAATLLDPFCGGGAAALQAKALGFSVVASDIANRAVVVARALIANSTRRIERADVLPLWRHAAETEAVTADVALAVFPEKQAQFLTAAFEYAARRTEPLRSLLQLLLIKLFLRALPMSMPNATDAKYAAAGDWDRVSPRRVGHYLRASEMFRIETLIRLAEEVNAGVFGGDGTALQGDALEIIHHTPATALYADPPYPETTGYARTYRPLDELLGDPPPPDRTMDLATLFIAAQQIPVVVLSYGGPTVSLDRLADTVRQYRPVTRTLAIHHPHLPAIATEVTNAERYEYLIVAGES